MFNHDMMSNFFGRIYSLIARFIKSNDILLALCMPIYKIIIKLFTKDVLLQFIVSKAKENYVVYDVGAYTGDYSLAIAKRFSQILIYAFEPNPTAYAELVRNIERTKLSKKIIPLNIALSDKRGLQNFYVSAYAPLSSLHSYNATYHNTTTIVQTIDVSCETIDYLVQTGIIKPPNIIKIDTEGNEYQVILGASNTTGKFQPAIGFETHGTDEVQGSTVKSITNLLSTFGYDCRSLGYPRYPIWCQVKGML